MHIKNIVIAACSVLGLFSFAVSADEIDLRSTIVALQAELPAGTYHGHYQNSSAPCDVIAQYNLDVYPTFQVCVTDPGAKNPDDGVCAFLIEQITNEVTHFELDSSHLDIEGDSVETSSLNTGTDYSIVLRFADQSKASSNSSNSSKIESVFVRQDIQFILGSHSRAVCVLE
jgi:hypothetical protein